MMTGSIFSASSISITRGATTSAANLRTGEGSQCQLKALLVSPCERTGITEHLLLLGEVEEGRDMGQVGSLGRERSGRVHKEGVSSSARSRTRASA